MIEEACGLCELSRLTETDAKAFDVPMEDVEGLLLQDTPYWEDSADGSRPTKLETRKALFMVVLSEFGVTEVIRLIHQQFLPARSHRKIPGKDPSFRIRKPIGRCGRKSMALRERPLDRRPRPPFPSGTSRTPCSMPYSRPTERSRLLLHSCL